MVYFVVYFLIIPVFPTFTVNLLLYLPWYVPAFGLTKNWDSRSLLQ